MTSLITEKASIGVKPSLAKKNNYLFNTIKSRSWLLTIIIFLGSLISSVHLLCALTNWLSKSIHCLFLVFISIFPIVSYRLAAINHLYRVHSLHYPFHCPRRYRCHYRYFHYRCYLRFHCLMFHRQLPTHHHCSRYHQKT